MDFDGLIAKAKAVTSLDEANAWLDRAFDNAVQVVGAAKDAALAEPIPDDRNETLCCGHASHRYSG